MYSSELAVLFITSKFAMWMSTVFYLVISPPLLLYRDKCRKTSKMKAGYTTLLLMYLKTCFGDNDLMFFTGSILVIHNIAYQAGKPMKDFSCVALLEHYMDLFKLYDHVGGDHFNSFVARLKIADRVITISYGYFWELKTSEGGLGLYGIINESVWKLRGIMNVVDAPD